ncbi:MAG: acyltransferase family protein, partial [Acidobacteriota bacterium]|nr:acyltransferase family protein [Acidobacteriota bacterium]
MATQAGTSRMRFHDLDALRGFAMLLGILLHAGVFLVPVEYWPVHEPWAWETPPEANVYAWILSVIHGFRMPLFFLLSGFFTAMLWQSRGLQRLWRHRLNRLGLPLAAGMFTVVPAIVWLEAGADFGPLDWLLAWVGGLHHLWFLWYLLLIAAAFVVAVRLGLTFRHPAWWLLVPMTVAPQYVMHELA